MEEINNLKENLAKIFQMKDMGQIKYCLGIEFNVKKNKVTMSQKKYVDDLLKRFGMENSKEVSTPMHPNVKLSKEMCPKTEKRKRRDDEVSISEFNWFPYVFISFNKARYFHML
jgi:hypothetical protein